MSVFKSRKENSSEFFSQDSDQQSHSLRGIQAIALTALVVSILYAFGYAFLGFVYASIFAVSFAIVYAVILLVGNTENVAVSGIALMGAGTSHIAGLGLLFIPPEGSSHLFMLLIPVYSLIAIQPKDYFWWWLYTTISVVVVVWLECYRDDFQPLLEVSIDLGFMPFIRGASIFFTLVMTTAVLYSFHKDLEQARADLQVAFQRSENLLLNILPFSIAKRLKSQQVIIADDFEDASVLFADLVGFTTLVSKLSASDTVSMLNDIFSAFDHAAGRYELEKIKTIGDAYMIAGGVPVASEDHLRKMILMAQEMLSLLELHNENYGHELSLRIGIASGPVTAGVIGARKFSYDIWGDTVNIASRMESTGVPGRIQVTAEVAEAVKEHFNFVERGLIDVKGKGKMRTFFLKSS